MHIKTIGRKKETRRRITLVASEDGYLRRSRSEAKYLTKVLVMVTVPKPVGVLCPRRRHR